MNTQMTLFAAQQERGTLLYFPGCEPPAAHPRKGMKQEVYAIKDPDDVRAMAQWLWANKDPKYLLAFTLGINLGLRANELVSLRTEDVFTPDGFVRCEAEESVTVWQRKVGKHRTLWLNEACKEALEAHWPHRNSETYAAGWLFPSREGGHICVRTLHDVLKEAAQACGVTQNIGTHSLRKTFGYHQYRQGQDIVMLQRLFGHSSPAVTLRYIGVAQEEERAAYRNVSVNLYRELGVSEPHT